MWLVAVIVRTGVGLGLTYTLFVLWMAAGLIGIIGFAMMIYGGLQLARGDDRPLDYWSLLRRLFRR